MDSNNSERASEQEESFVFTSDSLHVFSDSVETIQAQEL